MHVHVNVKTLWLLGEQQGLEPPHLLYLLLQPLEFLPLFLSLLDEVGCTGPFGRSTPVVSHFDVTMPVALGGPAHSHAY